MEKLYYVWKNLLVFEILHLLILSDKRELPAKLDISLHYSLKNDSFDSKKLIKTLLFLEVLSGQRPVLVKAKTNFDFINIREGSVISCKVTMSRFNSFHFFDKLTLLVLPSKARFEGFNISGFDKKGNFHQTLQDPFVLFPEIVKGYNLFKGLKGCLQINMSLKNSNILRSITFFSSLQLKLFS